MKLKGANSWQRNGELLLKNGLPLGNSHKTTRKFFQSGEAGESWIRGSVKFGFSGAIFTHVFSWAQT